ncbi:protein NCBP2AS2 homolog [Diadema antillarum]|uniref:protein NCBP2AS2 homolog n=1 Tax=Diadema antillarum TaxID=105358 RepID=UPI003A8A13BC
MVLRAILRYFANHPQLVDSLAESRFMRRLAQITAYGINKANEMGHEAIEKASESETLKKFADENHEPSGSFSSFGRTFAKELKEEVDKAQEKAKEIK